MEPILLVDRDDAAATARRAVVKVAGEIDLVTAPVLADRLRKALDTSPRCVLIDMSRTSFLSAAGLSVLVRFEGDAERAGVDVLLAHCPRRILRTLEVTGLLVFFRLACTDCEHVRT